MTSLRLCVNVEVIRAAGAAINGMNDEACGRSVSSPTHPPLKIPLSSKAPSSFSSESAPHLRRARLELLNLRPHRRAVAVASSRVARRWIIFECFGSRFRAASSTRAVPPLRVVSLVPSRSRLRPERLIFPLRLLPELRGGEEVRLQRAVRRLERRDARSRLAVRRDERLHRLESRLGGGRGRAVRLPARRRRRREIMAIRAACRPRPLLRRTRRPSPTIARVSHPSYRTWGATRRTRARGSPAGRRRPRVSTSTREPPERLEAVAGNRRLGRLTRRTTAAR